jgi:hypothetical protein
VFLSDSCFAIPTGLVWLVGLFVAIARWKQHPGVSAAVSIGMGAMLAGVTIQTIVVSFLLPSAGTRSMQSLMIGLGIMAVVVSLFRAAGWAAMLTAAFGWRDVSPDAARRPLWQFSIRNLLIVTFAVAVLCGIARAVVNLLGEAALYLLGLVDELPTFICWIYGGWLASTRRDRHPQVARRVATAIGLSVVNLLLGLITFAVAFIGSAHDWVFVPYFFMGVVVGPVSWALLLTAAFGWRTVDEPFRGSPRTACETAPG